MQTSNVSFRLSPVVLRGIAGKLKSGELKPADIIGFDLAASIMKTPADDRPEWAHDDATLRAFVIEYAKFFLLMAACPGEPLVPTVDQDDFGWHVHLAHPVAYFEACKAWAGRIIDHNGGFGNAVGEMPVLKGYFENTKTLWQEAFGEPHPSEAEAALCHKICKSCHSRVDAAMCYKTCTTTDPTFSLAEPCGVSRVAAMCYKM